MDITFRVQWRRLWKNLTIYMSIAIVAPVSLFVGFTWLTRGYEETFRHVSPRMGGAIAVGIVVFCAAFALGVALVCRLMSVRLTDHYVEGRNYWGLRKRLPLNQIMSMSRIDSQGLHAVIVSADKHGKIYILDQTESAEDLLALLHAHLEDKIDKEPNQALQTTPVTRSEI